MASDNLAPREIPFKNSLTVFDGGLTSYQNSDAASSGLYFSDQIFKAILSELSDRLVYFSKSKLPHHGNFFRRGNRLIKNGELLEKNGLCIEDDTAMHTSPTTEVYEFLEELSEFFKDIGDPEVKELIDELIISEALSEIVATLAARPGRHTSATVIAVHYGLIDESEKEEVLSRIELSMDKLEKYLYSAHLDIEEISVDLQFQGNYTQLLERARAQAE